MAEVTYFVALPFVAADDGIAAGEPTECFNPNPAVMRAEALSREEGHVGAVAFSRTGDPATGDFSHAKMIRKFGENGCLGRYFVCNSMIGLAELAPPMAKFTFSLAAFCACLLVAGEARAQSLTLSSPAINESATIANEQVFKGFGCTGSNVSPALNWSGAPAGTKSFAVTMYDPDAPTGSGWWHWVVFNLPPSVTSLPKGAGDPKKNLMPKGAVQSRTDFGSDGYGGPCPPPGDKPHRYQITVFAVDVAKLPDAKDHSASAALVGFDLRSHTLAKATLTGIYGR